MKPHKLFISSRLAINIAKIKHVRTIEPYRPQPHWSHAKPAGEPISFDELIALGRTSPGEAMSRTFIATLVKEGILGEVRVEPKGRS